MCADLRIRGLKREKRENIVTFSWKAGDYVPIDKCNFGSKEQFGEQTPCF